MIDNQTYNIFYNKTYKFFFFKTYRGSRRKLTIYDDDDDNTIDMSGLPSDSNDSKDSGDNNVRSSFSFLISYSSLHS